MSHGTIAWAEHEGRGVWLLQTAPYVTVRVKRMFPRANPHRKGQIMLTDTAEVARDLEWLMTRYPLDGADGALERVQARADEHRATEREIGTILSGERPHLEFRDTARPAREYQLTAADLILSTGRLLLCDVVGLGKTFSSLLVLREPDALPALVVCLTHLPSQWVEETSISLPWLKTHVVRTMKPYDPKDHRSMNGVDPDVVIVPYSKLRTWGDYLAGRVNTVIFDEVQELRKRHSQKWDGARTVAASARYRVGLTATPVYNYAGEIHSIFEVLAPDALGSREEFVHEWGGGKTYRNTFDGNNVSVGDPAMLGMYLRAEGLMLRRTRADVGRELPDDPERIPVMIDLDSDLLEREEAQVLDLAEAIVNRTLPGKDLFRARGELDWRLRRATGIAKARYVAEFVEALVESDEQVVLFGWHRDVYEVWRRKLAAYRPAFYTGTESAAHKEEARQRFLSGNARVLVMSLRAGAGLDGLQKASHIAVFGELDWSPGIHHQCLDAHTEILTRRGYCGPDDLRDDDLVACWDAEDESVRWSRILARVDRPLATGERMVEVSLPGVDLRVTSGHRMVWRSPPSGRPRPGDWKITEASVLVDRPSGWHLPVSGVQEAPGVPLTDAEIAFAGWIISDGHVNKKSRQAIITQDERSPENASIRAALNGAGLAWSARVIERSTSYAERSRIIAYTIPKWRSRMKDGTGYGPLEPWLDKEIHEGWEDATAEQLHVLLSALNDGDGSKMRDRDYTPQTWCIGMGRRLQAERLMSLAHRRGWRVTLSEIKTPKGEPHWLLRLREGVYRSVGGSDSRPRLTASVTVPGERVWCVTTETGTLLVRRNGQAAIVGNCIGRLDRDGQENTPVLAYFLVADSGSDPVVAEVLNLKRMQSEPIIDPDAPLLAPQSDGGDRVVRLAEYVRSKRRR